MMIWDFGIAHLHSNFLRDTVKLLNFTIYLFIYSTPRTEELFAGKREHACMPRKKPGLFT